MPKEHLRKGGLDAPDECAAVAGLYGQIGAPRAAFALIFRSPHYDLSELAVAIRQRCGELPQFVHNLTFATVSSLLRRFSR